MNCLLAHSTAGVFELCLADFTRSMWLCRFRTWPCAEPSTNSSDHSCDCYISLSWILLLIPELVSAYRTESCLFLNESTLVFLTNFSICRFWELLASHTANYWPSSSFAFLSGIQTVCDSVDSNSRRQIHLLCSLPNLRIQLCFLVFCSSCCCLV